MTSYPGPMVQRALLITELRALRRQASVGEVDPATALGWSPGRLARVENGASQALLHDLGILLDFYRIDSSRKEGILDLARGSLEQGWWQPYLAESDDPAFFGYLGHEGGASSISAVECMLVPGLLQTEDYARAVLREYRPDTSAERLDALVELRMRRQRLLNDTTTKPVQTYLIDEGALRRRMGRNQVMADQLERLLDESDRSHVTVLVLPLDVTHSGFRGPFWLLEGKEGVHDVLHLERTPRSSTFIGDSPEIAEHRVTFIELQEKALDRTRSKQLLRAVRDGWSSGDQSTWAN